MGSRAIHIRKHPDAATAKPVWCGQTGVASITEATSAFGLPSRVASCPCPRSTAISTRPSRPRYRRSAARGNHEDREDPQD